MSRTKEIVIIGIYVAVLLASQFILSGISGIEIITVLLLCFCYVFGVIKGMITATAFSLLRCLIFGFYPNIIILYLIYYNLFALFFGLYGKKRREKRKKVTYVLAIIFAIIFTVIFTTLDDIITPVFYGFSFSALKAYAVASLYALIPQSVCAGVTVAILFIPITKVLKNFTVAKSS